MFEYYWLRNYVALNNETQIERDLQDRTGIFNLLGKQGWELNPLNDEPHHFCFRRKVNDRDRKKYEYKWVRHYVPLYDDQQVQGDLDKRTLIFNSLAKQGWVFICGELRMYCFMREI